MGNVKLVMQGLIVLFVFVSVAYGAPGIHIRPVFEKSDNGIFDKNKEGYFDQLPPAM